MPASTPIRPPAPARFSTTTCCPSVLLSRCAMKRPLTSLPPPGAKGTMSFTGLTGYCCGNAGPHAVRAAAARSSPSGVQCGRIMKIPLRCSNLTSCCFVETPNDYPGDQAGQESGSEEGVVLQDARPDAREGAHQYADGEDEQHVGDAQGLRLGRREWAAYASQ